MDNKTEPTSFTEALIQGAPDFITQNAAIDAIKKRDLSRLFNDFDYTFTDDEFHTIMEAHAEGPVTFIQALGEVFKPLSNHFFNEDMTQLNEPFRTQIRTYFGEGIINDSVRVFDEHTNVFLQTLFDNIIYNEDNPLEKNKSKFEAEYKQSITPIQTYKAKKQARIEALLSIVQKGHDANMPAAIEQFKADAAQDTENFLKALDQYTQDHDQKKPDGTPYYADGTPGKVPPLQENDKKRFRQAQRDATDFTAQSFAIINEQKLVDETLNGIACAYNLALTSYPSEKSKQQALEETNAAEQEQEQNTMMTAEVMADIGILVNTVPVNPAFKHIFNDSTVFLRNDEAFQEASRLMLHNKKIALEMQKNQLLSEIVNCVNELNNIASHTSGKSYGNITTLASHLDSLQTYIDENCSPFENTDQDIKTLQQNVDHRLQQMKPLFKAIASEPLSLSWGAAIARAFATFSNALASWAGYTSNKHQETTPEEALSAAKSHSEHAVNNSIMTFKSRLVAIKSRKPNEVKEDILRAIAKAQDLSGVQQHYAESPAIITKPRDNNKANLLQDWIRIQQAGEVTINGEPLNSYNEFETEQDVLDFLNNVILINVPQENKDAALDYLQQKFHQDGLLFPVTASVQDLMNQTHADDSKPYRTEAPQTSTTDKHINITPTPQGFTVSEDLTIGSLMLAPHPRTDEPNRFLGFADENGLTLSAEKEGQPIIEAHGVVDVDFSGNAAEPTLTAEKNTITYGHRALASALHNQPEQQLDETDSYGHTSNEDSDSDTSDNEASPFIRRS